MQISRRALLGGCPAAILTSDAIAQAPTTASESSLSFLVVGDWGMPDQPQQRAVAAAMGRAARQLDCRFVISTGDNFYERGVSSVSDHAWETTFESVYTDDALLCPWYPVLGNHDHKGDVQAQIDYSKSSPRWTMPARFYRRMQVLDGVQLLELFFIDTTPLIETTGGSWIGDVLGAGRADDQYGWLEKTLRASRARWKIVVGHHPIYSGGPHAVSQELRTHLKPLLSRNGVLAYLNGHDHNLQHIVSDRIHYLTCGAGAKGAPPAHVEGSRFASAETGFLRFTLSHSAIGIEFIAADGQSLHTSELT